MDTLEQAIQFLRNNEVPFWWLFQGNSKVGQNVKEADIEVSIELLKQALQLLPSGAYKLECSANRNDRSGSFKFPFTKGATSASVTTMHSNTLNPGGLSDDHLSRIRNEERFKLKVEDLVEKMGRFLEEWPDYKKKIDFCYRELKDEDGDGIPDIMQGLKTVTEVVKSGKEMKGLFS